MEQVNNSKNWEGPTFPTQSPRPTLGSLELRSGGGILSRPSISLFLLATFFFLFSASTASAGTIRKPPNNLGLVAYWSFNEGTSTVVTDFSGNGHTGTITSGSIIYPKPTWVNGKFGKALDFSGTGPVASGDGRVSFTPLSVTTTHTVSMWIYLSSNCTSSYWGTLFASDGGDGLYCVVSGGNRVSYYYGGNDHVNNTNLSLNQWHHLAVVNSAGSATFYLDGVVSGTILSAPAYAPVGMGNDSGNEYFHGKIDETRVYSRALSSTEIANLYKSGTARIGLTNKSPGTLANGLTGYWTFDGPDISGTTAIEKTGFNATNATLLNGPTKTIGKMGQALKFDGTNDYVDANLTADYYLGATEGTVSVWMRPTATAPTPTSFAAIYNGRHAVGSSALYDFGITQANITGQGDKIWIYNSAYNNAIGVTYNLNEWIHITMAYTGGVTYLYKNGILAGSFSGGTVTLTEGEFYIGNGWAGASASKYFKGDIDEVRTYNRALTASEIKQLFNLSAAKIAKTSTPTGSLQTGLVGHFTFDGGDTNWGTNTTTNRGSVGGTGTLTNMSTTTSPVPGKIGQGLNFDNTNDYINLNSGALDPGTGDFSVSFWYKNAQAGNIIHGKGANISAAEWEITTSRVMFTTSSFGAFLTANYTSSLVNNDGNWHHFIVMLDRSTTNDSVSIYVDGAPFGFTYSAQNLNGENLSNVDQTHIGGNTVYFAMTNDYYGGGLDDVRIYNRALTAAEAKQLYLLGK